MMGHKNKMLNTPVLRQGQCGLAAVEMAFTITLLMMLMMATTELSRLFYQYNGLTKSVQSAARYLSEHASSASGTAVIAASDATIARNLVVYGSPANTGQPLYSGLSTGNVSLQIQNSRYAVVSVSWTYQTLFGTSLPTFGLNQSGSIQTGLTLHAALAERVLN